MARKELRFFWKAPRKDCWRLSQDLKTQPPPASSITEIEVHRADPLGLNEFTIRESHRRERPTVRISPDLPVCELVVNELFDPADRRYWYPYINCTNCGPRYTVVLGLPYDRANTTMQHWPLDDYCAAEYRDPGNRRFHAQPVACPACGPAYYLQQGEEVDTRKRAEHSQSGAASQLRAASSP